MLDTAFAELLDIVENWQTSRKREC